MEPVEYIALNDKILALIIRGEANPNTTAFFTSPEVNMQVGFVVYPAGGEITRHIHRPLDRHIVGTSEVLVVRRGRCRIDIYDEKRRPVATRELRTGDVVVMFAGGHGFHMLEDTTFVEIKQGPYTGLDEKERF